MKDFITLCNVFAKTILSIYTLINKQCLFIIIIQKYIAHTCMLSISIRALIPDKKYNLLDSDRIYKVILDEALVNVCDHSNN